jgi:diguanylate cyclase (GGDEF)-like protein/PAS domain S-box-containing protein
LAFSAAALQAEADSRPVLERLRAALDDPLRGDDQALLRERVRSLLATPDLGLYWLAVRDATGVTLIEAGRQQGAAHPLLPDSLQRALRQFRHRLDGHPGSLELRHAERMLGQVDYVIGPTPGAGAPPAAAGLRMAAAAGLALSLMAALTLMLLWRAAPATDRTPVPSGATAQALRRPPDGSGEAAPLAALLDPAGIGLIAVDRDGRIREMNRMASELCGWNSAEVRGHPVYSVFHFLDDGGVPGISAAERCLQDGRPVSLQRGLLRARRGEELPVEARAVPLKDAEGRLDGALMLFTDARPQRREVEEARTAAQLSQAVIDALDEGLLTTDRAGVVRSANARALRMFGYEHAELEGSTVSKLLPVPFLNTPDVRLTDYLSASPAVAPPRVVGWRKDATTFPVQLQVHPLGTAGAGLVLIVRDISERLRGEGLARRLGRLLDAAAEEIYVFEAHTLRFIECSRGASRSLGLDAEALQRLTPLDISADLDADAFHGLLDQLRSGEREQIVYTARHRRSDGTEYPVEARVSYSREEQPPVFMTIATDISDRMVAEDRLKQMAHQDVLTGLPNRRVLLARIAEFMRVADARGSLLAVLFIDLDHFKPINDARGHSAGDQVLRAVAQRLGGAVRGSDLVARLGGDEFAVLAGDLNTEADAARVGEKLLEAFAGPIEGAGGPLQVSASIGIALYPPHGADADTLLHHADSAMYRAKQAGRACWRLYSAPPASGG